jgi:transcriptional regulator with XRE-family HTH domain
MNVAGAHFLRPEVSRRNKKVSKVLTISERVSRLRAKMGLSQRDFATYLEVSRNYISMLEQGRAPGKAFVEKLKLLEGNEGLAPPPEKVSTSEHTWSRRQALKHARESAGISRKDLAQRIGYPANLIENIEEGRAPISEAMATKVAEALPDLDIEILLGGSETPRVMDESGVTGTYGAKPTIVLPPGMTARFVPRLSYTQAGAMQAWSDDLYSHEGVLAMNLPANAKAFALPVRGDSMEDRIREGDEVIALWGREPRNGQVVVACLKSGEVMCKIFHSKDRGEKVVLTSYNAAVHPPIELHAEEVRWIYPVQSVIQTLLKD